MKSFGDYQEAFRPHELDSSLDPKLRGYPGTGPIGCLCTPIAVQSIGIMGFREIRQRVIRSLRLGSYQIEFREVAEGKNLLDTGEVTPEDVIDLLARCRGDQHRISVHHVDPTLAVHIFLPDRSGERWYIKVFFASDEPRPDEEDAAIFISVHKSEFPGRGRR